MVEGINQRGRPAQFALALAAKDAGLVVDVAREAGVPAPVAAPDRAGARGGDTARDSASATGAISCCGWSSRPASSWCSRPSPWSGGEMSEVRKAEGADRARLLHGARRPGDAAAAAGLPLPRLRRALLPAPAGLRALPGRGHRRRRCSRRAAGSTPGRTCTSRSSARKRADHAGGYGVGQVDLPEGPRVMAVLQGGAGRLPDRDGDGARARDAAREQGRTGRGDPSLPVRSRQRR